MIGDKETVTSDEQRENAKSLGRRDSLPFPEAVSDFRSDLRDMPGARREWSAYLEHTRTGYPDLRTIRPLVRRSDGTH